MPLAARRQQTRSVQVRRAWSGLVIVGAGLACQAASAQQESAPALSAALHDSQLRQPPRLSLTLTTPLGNWTAPDGSLDVGLQWRQALGNQQSVDITAWRRVQQQPDALTLIHQREPVYGARVEMKIAPARSRLATDYKFIGLQLDSGARISLRRKDGNPTLYYRSSF